VFCEEYPFEEDEKTTHQNTLRVLINSFKLKHFLERNFTQRQSERDTRKKKRILAEIEDIQIEKIDLIRKRLNLLRKASASDARDAQINRFDKLLQILERDLHKSSADSTSKLSAKTRPNGHLDSGEGTSFMKLNEIGNFRDKPVQLYPKPNDLKAQKPKKVNYNVKIGPDATSDGNLKTLSAKKPAVQAPVKYQFVPASPTLDILHKNNNQVQYKVENTPDYAREAAAHDDEDMYVYDKIDLLNQDPRSFVNSANSPEELLLFGAGNSTVAQNSSFSMLSLNLTGHATTEESDEINADLLTQLSGEFNEMMMELDSALNQELAKNETSHVYQVANLTDAANTTANYTFQTRNVTAMTVKNLVNTTNSAVNTKKNGLNNTTSVANTIKIAAYNLFNATTSVANTTNIVTDASKGSTSSKANKKV
jgi:hypothetical protein